MMQQTGGSIFEPAAMKRKCCDRTSEGRPKRTRKTTKGDSWRNGTGDSQRRIRVADTDPLIEDDGGSDRYESDSDSDTEDNDEIDGRVSQSFTRGNLRRQYDQALVKDPALQQHYLVSGSPTRSLVVRENVLTIPEMTDRQIYDHLWNKHFVETGSTMKRGNHEVAVLRPDDLQYDVMLRELINQACGACDVTPFGHSRIVWYSDGNSIHKPHHDPTGGQAQPIVTPITNQRGVLA
jgi:hypothetical protein